MTPKRILILIPSLDFDPTETGVPFGIWSDAGMKLTFATPDGKPGQADPVMVSGKGLGPLSPFMAAGQAGRQSYAAMERTREFQNPTRWDAVVVQDFDALFLPGGHAKGMRPYLESPVLHALVASFFSAGKPVAAICHGALLAARSKGPDGASVLSGRKTTGLPRFMELLAWVLTCAWMGDYYRTYPEPLEDEVRRLLRAPEDFDPGPRSLARDSRHSLKKGFVVRDGNYLSARWPGDAHRFAFTFLEMLQAS